MTIVQVSFHRHSKAAKQGYYARLAAASPHQPPKNGRFLAGRTPEGKLVLSLEPEQTVPGDEVQWLTQVSGTGSGKRSFRFYLPGSFCSLLKIRAGMFLGVVTVIGERTVLVVDQRK